MIDSTNPSSKINLGMRSVDDELLILIEAVDNTLREGDEMDNPLEESDGIQDGLDDLEDELDLDEELEETTEPTEEVPSVGDAGSISQH